MQSLFFTNPSLDRWVNFNQSKQFKWKSPQGGIVNFPITKNLISCLAFPFDSQFAFVLYAPMVMQLIEAMILILMRPKLCSWPYLNLNPPPMFEPTVAPPSVWSYLSKRDFVMIIYYFCQILCRLRTEQGWWWCYCCSQCRNAWHLKAFLCDFLFYLPPVRQWWCLGLVARFEMQSCVHRNDLSFVFPCLQSVYFLYVVFFPDRVV